MSRETKLQVTVREKQGRKELTFLILSALHEEQHE